MKRLYSLIIITLLLILSNTVFSQTSYAVEVSNNVFTPAQLTISVGDTVRWTNTQGFHNVVADDNSFTSGAASSSSWVYEFVFNTVGSFPYYCSVHGGTGGVGMSGVITVEEPTGVTGVNIKVDKFELNQNYPNPFNPVTNISYQLPIRSHITLKVYNIIGNEVATLVNEEKPAGTYNVQFTTNNLQLSSGVYFYRIQAGSFIEAKEMILLK
jgi:plastocyanin